MKKMSKILCILFHYNINYMYNIGTSFLSFYKGGTYIIEGAFIRDYTV